MKWQNVVGLLMLLLPSLSVLVVMVYTDGWAALLGPLGAVTLLGYVLLAIHLGLK